MPSSVIEKQGHIAMGLQANLGRTEAPGKRIESSLHAFPLDSLVNFQPAGQAEQTFRVVGHLPEGAAGLQYRLRLESSGQERVAGELHLKQAE
jgi:hypothetical protein